MCERCLLYLSEVRTDVSAQICLNNPHRVVDEIFKSQCCVLRTSDSDKRGPNAGRFVSSSNAMTPNAHTSLADSAVTAAWPAFHAVATSGAAYSSANRTGTRSPASQACNAVFAIILHVMAFV
jgi:hypothetical protein